MKKQLTDEQKRADIDLWIIILVTFSAFGLYIVMGAQMLIFLKDSNIPIVSKLLLIAASQFGVAGLGISIVCIVRKETFAQFGLVKKNTLPAIAGTILCFIPMILFVFASGNFKGYQSFRTIIVVKDVPPSSLPISVLTIALTVIVWGFFEGFNYAVIADKINQRYPSDNEWLDYGAIICAMVCLLLHPLRLSPWGIVEMITTVFAIYGMLIVKKKTGNAWGCVFAFCFIWNAL